MSEELRLFAAIRFTKEINERLDAACLKMKAHGDELGADISWTKIENLHLTLKFIGKNKNFSAIPEVLRESCIRREPFTVQAKGISIFPNESRPAMVWARVHDQNDSLSHLSRSIESALEPLGVKAEPYPFTPHVTLGRVRSGRIAGEMVFPHKMKDFGSQPITGFELFESRKGQYISLERFSFH